MTNFLLLEHGPVIDPGKCGVCGYADRDRVFTDLRKDFEFYGTFIICELCVGAMAQDYGFLEPTRAKALESRVLEVESENIMLRAVLASLEKVRDAISDLDFERGVINNGAVASVDSTPTEPISEQPNSEPSELPEAEGSGDSEIDVDSGVEGPDDLLHLAQRYNAGTLEL